MDIKERIQNELKESLRAGDKVKISVLRQVLAAFHNLEIEKKSKEQEIGEADILVILKKEAKRRTEAIELFSKGERQDLVEQETQELKILQEYLPQQLSDSEIEKIIDEMLQREKTVSAKDFGRLMGILMKEFSGRAEPTKVIEILKNKLAN